MVARNDITGDSIQTRGTSKAFLDNYDLIFRKKTNTIEESTKEEFLQELVNADHDGVILDETNECTLIETNDIIPK